MNVLGIVSADISICQVDYGLLMSHFAAVKTNVKISFSPTLLHLAGDWVRQKVES